MLQGVGRLQQIRSLKLLGFPLEELRQRREALGEDAMRQAEQDWPELIEAVRSELERGTDPESESVQALAGRWRKLIEAFTGGNAGIEKSLGSMYRHNPKAAGRGFSLDSELMTYIGRAMKVRSESQ